MGRAHRGPKRAGEDPPAGPIQPAGDPVGEPASNPPNLRRMSQLLDRFERARRRGRIARLLVFLLLIGVAAFAGLRLYRVYHTVTSDMPKYENAFLDEMSLLLPTAAEDLFQIGINVFPDYRAAVEQDIQKNKEEILTALRRERDLFIQDLARYFLHGMVDRLLQNIAPEKASPSSFNDFADPAEKQALAEALNRAITEASRELVAERFGQERSGPDEAHPEAMGASADEELAATRVARAGSFGQTVPDTVFPRADGRNHLHER